MQILLPDLLGPGGLNLPSWEHAADNLRLGTDMVALRDSDVLDDKIPVRIRSHPVPKRGALFLCYAVVCCLSQSRGMWYWCSPVPAHMHDLYGVMPGLHYIHLCICIIYICNNYIYIYVLYIYVCNMYYNVLYVLCVYILYIIYIIYNIYIIYILYIHMSMYCMDRYKWRDEHHWASRNISQLFMGTVGDSDPISLSPWWSFWRDHWEASHPQSPTGRTWKKSGMGHPSTSCGLN